MVTLAEVVATGLPLSEHEQIAAALSVGRTEVISSPIGIGTVLAVMAPSGGDFLNALETLGATDANVKWALRMIERGTFDVGHPVTRAQLEAFKLTAPAMAVAIDALLSVAVVEQVVSPLEVAQAIERGV